jgi:hypothetical protein
MAAIDKALEFLKTSGSINYAATAKKFECDETTLRRRHQGYRMHGWTAKIK